MLTFCHDKQISCNLNQVGTRSSLIWIQGKWVPMKKSDDNCYFTEEESKRIWKAKTFVDVGLCHWIENVTNNWKLPWYGEKRICSVEVKNYNST